MKQDTFLEKLGFKDSELKTLKHDEIILSIFNNPNIILKNEKYKINEIILEQPIIQNGYNNSKFIIGYIDILISLNVNDNLYKVAIEVKPKIDNIGELLRQLQTYKTYLPNYTLAVCCPDDRFKEVIESQKFKFFKYEF